MVAATGGFAAKVTEIVAGRGSEWLSSIYRNHSENVRKKAQGNAEQFLDELYKRVTDLERQFITTPLQKELVESKFDDPGFALTLKNAIEASAITDDLDKHKILSRAIGERLLASEDSMIALTTPLAISKIESLNKNHLNFLGLCTALFTIRPEVPETLKCEEFVEWYSDKVINMFRNFLDVKMGMNDYSHLSSLSCIELFEKSFPPDQILRPNHKCQVSNPWSLISMQKDPEGKILHDKLYELWGAYGRGAGIANMQLTTIGQLIGLYVYDLKNGTSFRDQKLHLSLLGVNPLPHKEINY